MKALIYDPYLDTLGGGERYCLTVAECLLENGWRVDLFWDKKEEVEKAKKRFGLEIDKVGLTGRRPVQFSFGKRLKLERKYDFIFWLSDGSVPFLLGKKNFLHFQVPFMAVCSKNLFKKVLSKIKFKFIDQVVCNSQFTKKFVDKEFNVNSLVLYPPVDVKKFNSGKKENIILGVGRFAETMQAKRHDVLVKVFREMVDQGLKGWRLILAGGSMTREKNNRLLRRLRLKAKGYPIEFKVNVSFRELQELYARAKIFWHAAGYGVDEKKEPHRVEHFGITTVEAMAAGCVPVVIDKGGLREIVRRGVGERWRSLEELKDKTLKLIKEKDLWEKYALKSQKESLKFSKENFCRSLNKIINNED